jgi:hypothetical protein
VKEWRQFQLLVRMSLGRLMDTAVASRDVDAVQFAIWSFALIATPPFFHAAKMMGKYNFLWRQPERLTLEALGDRLFFIIYVMLACSLLAAVLWDALFPDRQDQEIAGVLPVRPRTVAAARLATSLGVATVFSLGLALPSGFVYAMNVAAASRSSVIIGTGAAVFVGHVLTLTVAGVFTFAALLALRGIVVLCVGTEVAQRVATLLQLVTVILLVETFMFLPGLLDGLVAQLNVASTAAWFAPLWFLGMYATFAGPPVADVPGREALAIAVSSTAVIVAVLVYLLPAAWNGRRALEAPLKNRASRSVAFVRHVASPLLRDPVSQAVFGFVVASLLRSRRHALTVATYLGTAIAIAGLRLMVAAVRDQSIVLDAPVDYLFSIPLALTFFLVIGLRAAFAVPTDVDANWTFRTAQPRATGRCVHAAAVALVVLAVLPVSLVWLVVASSLWDGWTAVAAVLMHLASGVALVELVMVGSVTVPFTRAHAAATSRVRFGWVVLLVALHLYAYRLEDLQLAALGSPAAVVVYVLSMTTVAALARAYQRVHRAGRMLDFEAPVEGAPALLNLSQAVG